MGESTAFEALSYRLEDNGVVYITLDVPGHKVNVLTPGLHAEIGQVAEKLAADDKAIGAVIHSGKAGFMAGGKDWAALRSAWSELAERYPNNRFGTHASVVEDAPE